MIYKNNISEDLCKRSKKSNYKKITELQKD